MTQSIPAQTLPVPLGPGVLAQRIGRLLQPAAWSRVRALADVVLLCLASTAALFAAPVAEVRVAPDSRVTAALFPVVAFGLLRMRPGPDERISGSMLETLAHITGVLSLAAMLCTAADVAVAGDHPGPLALRLWLFSTVYVGLSRAMLLSVRRHASLAPGMAVPTLIVGAGNVGELLARRLVTDHRYGLRPVGFVDADPLPRAPYSGASLPVLGGLDELERALEISGARRVIVAFSAEPDHVLVRKLRHCQQLGVEVSLVPRLFETVNERALLDRVGGVPLVTLHPTDPHSWQFALKHAVDRVFAAAALLLLAPLMVGLALAVRLSSPGLILFRQRRIGRDGKEFDLLKFRTMRQPTGEEHFEPAAGCAPGGVEGVDRRTRIGTLLRKTSLDELPQFINVLRGDMSLVGPRPERPEFVERFASEHARYEDRHRVKSGITGWAQVNGLRGQTSVADRVEWDNYYIQNWSLGLDLRIILLTLLEILRFRG